MKEVTASNFGLLIAYLVPGFTTLWGASFFSPTLRAWLGSTPPDAPTIGGFLYITIGSVAAGMTVSAIRWMIVDTMHRFTGLPIPPLDFSRLGPNVEAFGLLIGIHYHHYLFYSNMGVATAIAYACYRASLTPFTAVGWPDLLFLPLEAVFLVTSRDTLRRYYDRSRQLLSRS